MAMSKPAKKATTTPKKKPKVNILERECIRRGCGYLAKEKDDFCEKCKRKGFMLPSSRALTKPKVEKQSVVALSQWNQFLAKGHVNDFSAVPTYAKLTFLQSIPSDLVEFRNIAGTDFPYIPHEFSEKALNFVFNFNVNAEIIWKEIERTKDGKAWDVIVEVKFTFYDHTKSREIVRTVFSGHKSYDNKAITKADAYKAALSKAYTVVARQFGIGSNVKYIKKPKANAKPVETIVPTAKLEKKAYKAAEEKPEKKAVKKSFAPKKSAQSGAGF